MYVSYTHLDVYKRQIKNIDNVNAAAFFYEKKPGEIKASLRSDEAVDVCEIAKKFGGGGHVRASGCTLFGAFDEVMPGVIDCLLYTSLPKVR